MKHFLLIITIFISVTILAQDVNYQTYSAALIVVAQKNDSTVKWTNKNIIVHLNYETGNISIKLYNNQFTNSQENIAILENTDNQPSEYSFTGILPINDIINQQQINQGYDVELELQNSSIGLTEMVNFKMNITKPEQSENQYRIFTLSGTLNNSEVNIPAFKGYNNEIGIRILFNAFWNNL